jgi:hypothetical protein
MNQGARLPSRIRSGNEIFASITVSERVNKDVLTSQFQLNFTGSLLDRYW